MTREERVRVRRDIRRRRAAKKNQNTLTPLQSRLMRDAYQQIDKRESQR